MLLRNVMNLMIAAMTAKFEVEVELPCCAGENSGNSSHESLPLSPGERCASSRGKNEKLLNGFVVGCSSLCFRHVAMRDHLKMMSAMRGVAQKQT